MNYDTDIDYWRAYINRMAKEQPSLVLHLTGVAARAAAIAQQLALPLFQQRLLHTAGLVHDIGKVPYLANVGFHPIDGALVAHDHGAHELAQLIAHHTGARYEAELYGIDISWEWKPSILHDVLCFADLTTMPDGTHVSVATRRADIEARYAADSVQVRSLNQLWSSVVETERYIKTSIKYLF